MDTHYNQLLGGHHRGGAGQHAVDDVLDGCEQVGGGGAGAWVGRWGVALGTGCPSRQWGDLAGPKRGPGQGGGRRTHGAHQ